jgi:hypothetical protein
VVVLDPVGAGEDGDRPGHAQGTVEPAGAEAEAVDGGHEGAAGGRHDLAVLAHLGRCQVAVLGALTALLDGAGGQHPRPYLRGRLGIGGTGELVGGEPVGLDVQVDAVQQRPGEPAGVTAQVVQATPAGEAAIPQMPARAGIGGRVMRGV